jgi:hypothetical protein
VQIELDRFTKQYSMNDEVAALKRKHEAEIALLKQQAETSHNDTIARITRQYQDRLVHDVEAGVKERWNVLQTLGSFGSMAVSTPALVGICADCDEKKSELATLKAQYDALQGVFKRSAACVHCAVKEYHFNEAVRQGWEMKAELEKSNEELEAENEKLKTAIQKSKTDHSGLLALLLEKNSDASQLRKERDQLQVKASCANCIILEEQNNKLNSHCSTVELQAREGITRLHAREQWLLQEGNRLVNDFQGERSYLQNEIDRRQNLLDDRNHQQGHRRAQSDNGHNGGKRNNWNDNGKGGGRGYHSDGNHNYSGNNRSKGKNREGSNGN